MPGPVRNANDQPDPDPRLDPRPGARSARRTWLLAGALSLAAHGSGFCIVARPNAVGQAAGLGPRSLDATRVFHQSEDCS